MLNDATLKNVPKSVEDAINSCTDPSSLRQMALNSMAEAGIIVRHRGDDLNYRLNPDAVERPAASSLPAARPAQEPTCYRVLYLHGNDRLEIYGMSEAELDQKERQLRAMYGSGQR
jgi:hypothetical protein